MSLMTRQETAPNCSGVLPPHRFCFILLKNQMTNKTAETIYRHKAAAE